MEKTINAAIDKANKDRGTSIDHVSVTSDATNKKFSITSGMKGTGASSIGFDQSAKPSTNKTVLGIVVGVTDTQTTTAATSNLIIDPTSANGSFNMLINGEEVNIKMCIRDSSYTVAPRVRSDVIFRTFNLMSPIRFSSNFDVIFCRNVTVSYTHLYHLILNTIHFFILFHHHSGPLPRVKMELKSRYPYP